MTPQFRDPFRGEQIDWRDGRPVWRTLAPLRWGDVIIPADFITDLASVPRAPFAFWIAGGRGTRSAVLHDFPYQFGYWLLESGGRRYVTREEADRAFYESLLVDPISGAGPVVARLMYTAVVVGGRGHWRDLERTASLNPIWSATGGMGAP